MDKTLNSKHMAKHIGHKSAQELLDEIKFQEKQLMEYYDVPFSMMVKYRARTMEYIQKSENYIKKCDTKKPNDTLNAPGAEDAKPKEKQQSLFHEEA